MDMVRVICDICDVLDDESHRINTCRKGEGLNRSNSDEKIVYDDIYSGDHEKCLAVIRAILALWNLQNGKNEMRPLN